LKNHFKVRTRMTRTRLFFLASVLLCTIALPAFVLAQDQTTPPADTKPAADAQSSDTKPADTKPVDAKPATDTKPPDTKPATDAKSASTKLPIKAALVLTPEFCATKIKPKGSALTKEWGTFEVGKAACEQLEPALKEAFSSLTRVAAPPAPQEAQLLLLPRIVDVNATTAMGAFSNREMVVILEWTAKDPAGNTVWLETVQGSAKHHMGNLFTFKKNQVLIVTDSVKDAAVQSAGKMSSSPELRKLGQ
jgi:hypothetical protein